MALDSGKISSLTLREGSPVRLNLPETGTFLMVEYHAKGIAQTRKDKASRNRFDDIDPDTTLGKVRERTYAVDQSLIATQSV